jgi:signal peptidase II
VRIGLRVLFLAVVMASTIGCDRVTKHMATALLADKPTQSFLADSVRLVYAENTGGFLSLGAQLPPVVRTSLFTIMTGLVLIALLVTSFRSRWSFWRALGLALFAAGGVSNWVDRVISGSVVDFMNVGVGWLRTGIFNFADVAIMLGAVLLVLSELSGGGSPNKA